MVFRRSPYALPAGAVCLGLAAAATLSVMVGRPFYADGAFYLLRLLQTGDFHHQAWTRTGSTFLTQVATVAAMRAGVSDIDWLARIYGASLCLPPLAAYFAATWLAIGRPALFTANVFMVVVCFFPTAMMIMEEFQPLYSLFWCGFVLLVTGRARSLWGAGAVLVIAIAIAASYEISVALCPVLALATVLQGRAAERDAAKVLLYASTLPLLAGAAIGAAGILAPRDPANSGQFLRALGGLPTNVTLLALSTLAVSAGFASAARPDRRRAAGAIVALACIAVGVLLPRMNEGPALGQAYDQRAQVVPLILALAALCGASSWRRSGVEARPASNFDPWPLLLPLALVVALDLHDSLGWRRFLGAFCAALDGTAEDRSDLPRQPIARQYGWAWTYPTLSVLLGSGADAVLVRNPDPAQWQPFDPDGALPEIARYKLHGGMCRLVAPTS